MKLMIDGKLWKESDLINDYLKKKYPTKLQWRRVHVGPLPDTEDARFYKVTQRWADAIVFDAEAEEIIIIEAKLRTDAGAIGQLELYAELFPTTPQFNSLRTKQIRKVFLCPDTDIGLIELCSKKNIDYVVWPSRD